MPWSSSQPDAGPPVFNSQANLVRILSTHLRDERLSHPCPAPGSNPRPVAWQHKTQTTAAPGFIFIAYFFENIQPIINNDLIKLRLMNIFISKVHKEENKLK